MNLIVNGEHKVLDTQMSRERLDDILEYTDMELMCDENRISLNAPLLGREAAKCEYSHHLQRHNLILELAREIVRLRPELLT